MAEAVGTAIGAKAEDDRSGGRRQGRFHRRRASLSSCSSPSSAEDRECARRAGPRLAGSASLSASPSWSARPAVFRPVRLARERRAGKAMPLLPPGASSLVALAICLSARRPISSRARVASGGCRRYRDLFGTAEWRNRGADRRRTDRLSCFLAIFVVMIAMGLVTIARWIWQPRRHGVDAADAARLPPSLATNSRPRCWSSRSCCRCWWRADQQRYALDTAIQILTYIMLGWGLNVVVGLAGLLDLGYVAFYAVGAYSYALISAPLRLVVLGLPAAGRHVRRPLGDHARLPRAAAQGRLSRHRHARIRRDHPHRAAQLVILTNGPNGISRIPKLSFFGLSFDRSRRQYIPRLFRPGIQQRSTASSSCITSFSRWRCW